MPHGRAFLLSSKPAGDFRMKLESFREFAKEFNVIPVSRTLLADSETPLGVYRK